MTNDQVGGLMLIGIAMVLYGLRKKRPARADMVFIEMIEMVEIKKRPKAPTFVKNLAILAGIVAFIWVVYHS
jgi:hypothetical protein